MDRAADDLSAIARRIREAEPVAIYSYGVDVSSLRAQVVGDSGVYLGFLMLAVGAVLLIAVANLASANLARGVSRTPEMAVRAALGAGRRRVARQLLVEHLCIALLGGAAGTAFAMAAVGMIRSVANDLPRAASIAVDGRVLLFGFGVSLLTGVLTGLLPALQASRASPQQIIGRAGRSQVRGGRGLPGQALVGTEIALALILFACAGLLIGSLRAVLARPLGFDTQGIVTASLPLLTPTYRATAARDRYWREILTTLRAAPGVERAALVNWAPLSPGGSTFIETDGTPVAGAGAGYRVISDGYFATLGIPLLAGRDIEARDDSTGPRVVVINDAMAQRYWPGQRPVGRRVRARSMEGYATEAPWLTIVGVVASVRHYGYEADELPEMYVSYRQRPDFTFGLTAVVRGREPADALPDEIRVLVRRQDPAIAPHLTLLEDDAARRTASRRLTMNVLSVFAALALLLAAIGVYSVLSFSVAQRSREIALRAALGADRRSLLALVLSSAGRVVVLGILAGLAGLAALRGVIRATLYGVESGDPLVLAIAVLLIGAVAMLAALVPALRGTRVELREALSAE
jgi:predicted permease